jgi:hypothetical protein
MTVIQSQRQAPGVAQGDADIQRRIQQPSRVQALIRWLQVKAGKAGHNPATQQRPDVPDTAGRERRNMKKMISQMAAC